MLKISFIFNRLIQFGIIKSGEEFARKFSSNIESIEASNDDYKPYACDFLPGQYPAQIDLRDIGHLTSIKNQGNCGACWAFATICTIESLLLASKVSEVSFRTKSYRLRFETWMRWRETINWVSISTTKRNMLIEPISLRCKGSAM